VTSHGFTTKILNWSPNIASKRIYAVPGLRMQRFPGVPGKINTMEPIFKVPQFTVFLPSNIQFQ
jgi:hypothetical protein